MDSLVGKTVVAAEQMSDAYEWDEKWKLVCADGSEFTVESRGAAYCSSYLKVEEIKHE